MTNQYQGIKMISYIIKHPDPTVLFSQFNQPRLFQWIFLSVQIETDSNLAAN